MLKDYIVYFELYGKKMQTIIKADNAEEAKYMIMGKIVFHKIHEKVDELSKDLPEGFKEIFGL